MIKSVRTKNQQIMFSNIYQQYQSNLMRQRHPRNLTRILRKTPSSNSTIDQTIISKTNIQIRTTYNKKFTQNQNPTNQSKSINKLDITNFPKHLKLSSTNWCLYDSNSSYFLGYREDIQRQVASLTKIMTTVIAIELIESYQLDKNLLIKVSKISSSQTGTSANLKQGKWIKLYDLLYGIMLPSGNDAAYLVAEVFGLLLFYQTVKSQDKSYSQIQCIDLSCYETTWTFVNRFLKQMNKKARQLKMKKTCFANPHGLTNVLNTSTARDILTLSKYALSNSSFRKIANSETYETELYGEDNIFYEKRRWKNTNKLLGVGWEGVKTGHTLPAGACLSSLRQGVFIVLLNCDDPQSRFLQTVSLYEWHKEKVNGKLFQDD